MGIVTVMGAALNCSAGTLPAVLDVPFPPVFINAQMVGQILDIAPEANIPLFGICEILTAMNKVPTPCAYMPASPWLPTDPTILINATPILSQPSDLQCVIGGDISIDFPGQVTVVAA